MNEESLAERILAAGSFLVFVLVLIFIGE